MAISPWQLVHLHISSKQDNELDYHIAVSWEGSYELVPSGPESTPGDVQGPGSGAAPDLAVAGPVGAA